MSAMTSITVSVRSPDEELATVQACFRRAACRHDVRVVADGGHVGERDDRHRRAQRTP